MTAVALNEVREAIIQVVSQLAEVKGFNLVVPSSTVLVFSPRIDVTQDVLVALNQRLPDVKVAEAAPIGAGAAAANASGAAPASPAPKP